MWNLKLSMGYLLTYFWTALGKSPLTFSTNPTTSEQGTYSIQMSTFLILVAFELGTAYVGDSRKNH